MSERNGDKATAPTTAVLLCGGLQGLASGLDLAELRRWVAATHADVQVRVAPELCHAPKEVSPAIAAGAQRLVLGVCSPDYAEAETHSIARKLGLDPLGIEALDMGRLCALAADRSRNTEKAKLLLAGAIAKVRAYVGSGVENLKPVFPSLSQKLSRRALFTLPPLRYQAVASVSEGRCAAEAGCALCLRACPRNALEDAGGKVEVNKARCDACGLCMAACLREAIELPGSSPAQLQAQIAALLNADSVAVGERRILFTCRRSSGTTPASWLPVQVPCVGMVSVSSILQCLAHGAAAVGVAPCGPACTQDQGKSIQGKVDFCRELLRLLGGQEDQVRLVQPGDGTKEAPGSAIAGTLPGRCPDGDAQLSLFGPAAVATALQKLARERGSPNTLSLEHPHSPLGVVVVQPQLCTGCGGCAGDCPTGALQLRRDGEGVALTFDAALCVACGQCLAACPEASTGAIGMGRVVDLAKLALGRVTVYQDREARCEACGAPIAPSSMLHKVAALLGEESAPLAARIGRYCTSCKGIYR